MVDLSFLNARTALTKIKELLIVALAMCLPSLAIGQQSVDGLWKTVSKAEFKAMRTAQNARQDPSQFRPMHFKLFSLDMTKTKQRLGESRPMQRRGARVMSDENAPATEMSIPQPDGSFMSFYVEPTHIMSPALAKKFPNIKAFRGVAVNDPTITAQIDVASNILRAQILSSKGTIVVDPFGDSERYASFYRHMNRAQSHPFQCLVTEQVAQQARAAARAAAVSGANLRTYRLAVACTGEYARFFGGTKAGAMSAIHTTINRVNGIYERELAIRIQLIDNNDRILFTNPNTDPFSNNSARTLIGQSQRVIDTQIGRDNYDVGHTFSTGAGGLAGLGVVCRDGVKARGVTGRTNPIGDPFDVDFVAHELGHQFGGDHTFNGRSGSCGGTNRNSLTAFEPGSGSTIQAYAGICRIDDLQRNSDPYFHSASLDQMIDYTTIGAGNVPTPTPTGNQVPEVDAGTSHAIPIGTPFALTAVGRDDDGDSLTYCWEQRDLGPAANLSDADDGQIPLFRSTQPTSDPIRYFPKWSDILSNNMSVGERLPSQSRQMNFRVTVRDNRLGGGGVNGADLTIDVTQSAGPFKVTSPITSQVSSRIINVQWDVAQTNLAPVDCQNVQIWLSTDSGQTFSTLLADNTKNDGHETVMLPIHAQENLRLMVRSVGNIFFAVSPVTFSVEPSRATIVLVRHADVLPVTNPDLTPIGQTRAADLATLLAPSQLDHVFSTDTPRTIQTATQTAESSGVDIQKYSDLDELTSKLSPLEDNETVLVVGHSNTVGPLASRLGSDQAITIRVDEFSKLVVINLTDDAPRTGIFQYGANGANGPGSIEPTEGIDATFSGARRATGDDDIQDQIREIGERLERIERQLERVLNGHDDRHNHSGTRQSSSYRSRLQDIPQRNMRSEQDANARLANDADSDGLTDEQEAMLGTNPNNPDTDGDALLDGWEVHGVNGIDLRALGASPLHKDIFIEMDFMKRASATNGLGPNAAVLAAIKACFESAPVSNPDGQPGIEIHLEIGNEVPFDRDLNPAVSEFNAIKRVHFAAAKAPVYHYMLWADRYNGNTSSGNAFAIPNSDFIVTLGGWNGNRGGTDQQKVGTFIHELGHNLGLTHGGSDHVHRKPNHLSVMNYQFQTSGILRNGVRNHDYQTLPLPSLNEFDLDEPNGLGVSSGLEGYSTKFFNPQGRVVEAPAHAAIDWNTNGSHESGVIADINRDSLFNVLQATPNEWNALIYNGGTIGTIQSPVDGLRRINSTRTLLPFVELTEEMNREFNN